MPRPRLFAELDAGRNRQVVWVSAAAGAGKSALVASYLDHLGCSRRTIWYKMDTGDADPASFFFCLGLAFPAGLAVYRKGVEMEPLAELVNEGIIRAYSAAGYNGEAVQSYKKYEHALMKNLGIPPARRINQLISAP